MLQRAQVDRSSAQITVGVEGYRHRLSRLGSTTATASIGATLHTNTGGSIHILSAHLPHHATLEQTHHHLQEWQASHTQLQQHPCIIGADWNETFNTDSQTATTARGDLILDWLSQHNHHLPPQHDNIPSYHPYNTQMRSRRLDYISTSRKVAQNIIPLERSRDFALSDHEAVVATVTYRDKQGTTSQTFTHHPMKLKQLGVKLPHPPANAHPWDSLAAMARTITEAYPKAKFQESRQLKQHRHKLTTGQIPQDQTRQRWKLIQAAHKREGRRQRQKPLTRVSGHHSPAPQNSAAIQVERHAPNHAEQRHRQDHGTALATQMQPHPTTTATSPPICTFR